MSKPTTITFSRYRLPGTDATVFDVLRNGQAYRRPTEVRQDALDSLALLTAQEEAEGRTVKVEFWDGDAGRAVASTMELP